MPEEVFETPQTVEPTAETKPTNWPKIILAAVLGLGLLVGASYAGYWYGTQEISKLKNQISNPQLKTEEPTLTPTLLVEDEARDWKTYRNEGYSFQIKYPSRYEPTPVGYPSPPENVLLLLSDFSTKQENNFVPLLSVTIHKQIDSAAFDESITGKLSHMQIVDGLEAKIYKEDEYVSEDVYISSCTAFINLPNDGILEVEIGQMQNVQVASEILNQILTTFKFLD